MPEPKNHCVVKAIGNTIQTVEVNGRVVPFDLAEGAEVLLPSDDGPGVPCVSLLIRPDVLVIEQVTAND